MKYAIYDSHGEVLQIGEALESDIDQMEEYLVTGHSIFRGGVSLNDLVDLVSGELVEGGKPPQSTPFSVFDYTSRTWAPDTTAALAAMRRQRNALLRASDWRVTKATEAGQPVDPAWMTYRQALRDITLQADPWAIVWPVAQGAVKIEPGASNPAPGPDEPA